jgi:hypothetical protein
VHRWQDGRVFSHRIFWAEQLLQDSRIFRPIFSSTLGGIVYWNKVKKARS